MTIEEAIEQIDIGGPSMVRSASKNHASVTIATSPDQYAEIAEQIKTNGCTTAVLRRDLAIEAFAMTAMYDVAISSYLEFVSEEQEEAGDEAPDVPEEISIELLHRDSLRYGENPHQEAFLFEFDGAAPNSLVNAEQLNGKELSYNNYLDLDAALGVARSLPSPGVAVLKHNNPCGAATAETLGEATEKAWAGDPVSAFGSVLGVNVPVDAAMAECLAEPGKFVEAIVAPEFTSEALEILTTKPKWKANVRLLAVGEVTPGHGQYQWRQIDGGMLCQTGDDLPDEPAEWKVVTEAQPTEAQHKELEFAWAVCRHVKSNAIVLTRDQSLVGAGAGQMSRVDSVEIAIRKAGRAGARLRPGIGRVLPL